MFELRELFNDTISYVFNDDRILKEALTPPHLYKEVGKDPEIEFKRLKWLGNGVLDMVVTENLYRYFPEDTEGDLAIKKSYLISSNTLLKVAESMDINKYICRNGNEKDTISYKSISETVEAIIGAIYIDGGLDKAKRLISKYWSTVTFKQFENVQRFNWDPKSYFKTWSEKNKKTPPRYNVIKVSGPSHCPTYKVKLFVKGIGESYGVGTKIREAEQRAAKDLYERLVLNSLENSSMKK